MKQYLFNYTRKRKYLLLIGDMLVLVLSIFISYFIRVCLIYKHPNISEVASRFHPWLIIVVLAHIFTLYLLDQYNLNRLINLVRSSVMTVLSVWLAGLLISGVFFFFPKYVFGRQVLLIHLLMVSIFMVLWRLFYKEILAKATKPKQVAVVGSGHNISSFIEDMSHIPNPGFRVDSVCVTDSDSPAKCLLLESMTKQINLIDLIKNNDFDILLTDSTDGVFSNEEIQHLLQIKYKGKSVYDLSSFYKDMTGKVPLSYVNGQWLLTNHDLQGEVSKPYLRIKRLLDVVMSSLLLIFLSPVFIIVACIIKVEGKGSIIYRQERLGMGKKPFVCYKFRTMIQDAEKLSGPVFSTDNDSRVTRLGKFLRKSRLDELPQLWNILKGEMSFVGPRPIREYFALQMAERVPFYWLRYDIKPGVTGWAQVNGQYAVPNGLEAFEYELFYIQNMSIFLDLMTMFKTMQTLIWEKGK